jgi:High potential iron-sulfur protein
MACPMNRPPQSQGHFMNNPRRIFLMTLAAGSAALVSGAHAQAKLDEKDPQAVALGYVSDATKADSKRFPKYAAGQQCGNCALFQGKPGDA